MKFPHPTSRGLCPRFTPHFTERPFGIVVFLVAAFLCVNAFVKGGAPGFRDGAHFYGPLFEYLQQEVSQGRLPLWNPYENLGQPLLANPTTMFFYPPMFLGLAASVLFRIDSQTFYTLYVNGHFLLAMLCFYRLARYWRCSRHAAALGSLCYVLSGNVLFQCENVPFLIGAAWFPEAIHQADKLARALTSRGLCPRFTPHFIAFAVVLSLMILGGDPQAAYNAIICAAVLAAFATKTQVSSLKSQTRVFFSGISAVLLAALLSAVQILPSTELALLSDRSLVSHGGTIYHFSVAPWRFLEFLWPNAGGWQLPVNARWFSFLPHDKEIWVPSFYMGLLPVLAATATIFGTIKWNCSYRNRRLQALLILLAIFCLGSLGNWCFVYSAFEMLPGYRIFRFPAKLLTVASCILSIFAAVGFDRLRCHASTRYFVRKLIGWYAVPITLGVFVLCLPWSEFAVLLKNSRADCPLFGPFNMEKAWFCLIFTVFTVIVVVLTSLWTLKRNKRTNSTIMLFVVFFDLVAANHWMLATTPINEPRAVPSVHIASQTAAPTRIYRHPVWYPESFGTKSSENRLTEAIHWDRQSLYPRYTLPMRVAVVDVRGTVMPKDFYPLSRQLRGDIRNRNENIFVRNLSELDVHYIVATDSTKFHEPNTEAISLPLEPLENVSFWEITGETRRRYETFEPNRLVFQVESQKNETITILEQYWPGWRARIEDGTEFNVQRGENELFRSIDLPPGRHRVTMWYDPLSFKIGAALSILGLLIVFYPLSLDIYRGHVSRGL